MGGGDSSSVYANKLTFDHHDEIMKRSGAVNLTGLARIHIVYLG